MRLAGLGENPRSPVGDACELLSLEKVYLTTLKHPDHAGREVQRALVVVYEAGKRDVRGRFTVEDLLQ